MSITSAELIAYAAADLVTDDVTLVGGAIDATGGGGIPGLRPVFTQIAAGSPEKVDIVSDGADVRNVTLVGRDATGALITEVLALTGAVIATTTHTFERLLKVTAASSSGSRTVTVTGHVSITTFGTIPVNELGFYANFINSASDPAADKDRYEKFFWKNTDATLTLTTATVTLTVDATTLLEIALEASVNGNDTAANRLTAPSGESFFGVGTALNVPGGGNLAAGAGIGVWVHQDLATGNAPVRSPYTTQLAGNTI